MMRVSGLRCMSLVKRAGFDLCAEAAGATSRRADHMFIQSGERHTWHEEHVVSPGEDPVQCGGTYPARAGLRDFIDHGASSRDKYQEDTLPRLPSCRPVYCSDIGLNAGLGGYHARSKNRSLD